MKNFTVLILIYFLSNGTQAQPGWIDWTKRYFYNILDKNGKEISFKNDSDYKIMIDSLLYETKNIPQDSLKRASSKDENFEIQIRINDFSLAIPKYESDQRKKPLEIKVISENDTMFICQPSGLGSTIVEWTGENLSRTGRTKTPPPDFILKFIPGHYFFPHWAKELYDNLPKVQGSVNISNFSQQNFIIPETIYNAIDHFDGLYNHRKKSIKDAEQAVLTNFIKGYFSFSHEVQPTTFDENLSPFDEYRWKWNRYPYFPTKKKDEYLGILSIRFDSLNVSGGRGLIARFNRKENHMRIWSPTENLSLSSTSLLRRDSFNNTYYNKSYIKDPGCKNLFSSCESYPEFYRSADEGITWEKNDSLTLLHDKYEFNEIEFIDHNHAVIFKYDKIKPEGKKRYVLQGIYYLVRDFIVIDSLKTPDDINYGNEFSHYKFEMKDDTIFLGRWTYDKQYHPGVSKYFYPTIRKVDNEWTYEIIEKTYSRRIPETLIDTIYYNNISIYRKKIFPQDTRGSLEFKNELAEVYYNGFILENGQEIYILGFDIGIIFSFDGGLNWLIYPVSFEKYHTYMFLEINERSVISYVKNVRENYENRIIKIFNQFMEVEE